MNKEGVGRKKAESLRTSPRELLVRGGRVPGREESVVGPGYVLGRPEQQLGLGRGDVVAVGAGPRHALVPAAHVRHSVMRPRVHAVGVRLVAHHGRHAGIQGCTRQTNQQSSFICTLNSECWWWKVERIRSIISLCLSVCLSLSLFLSESLSVCLSVRLSVSEFFLSVSLSLPLSISLCVSLSLSVSLSVSLSLLLSFFSL